MSVGNLHSLDSDFLLFLNSSNRLFEGFNFGVTKKVSFFDAATESTDAFLKVSNAGEYLIKFVGDIERYFERLIVATLCVDKFNSNVFNGVTSNLKTIEGIRNEVKVLRSPDKSI